MFFWRRFAAPHLCLRGISSETPSVTLRPYQEACLQACIDALDSGISRIGVSLPTGSGKTTVFVSLLARIHPPRSNPRAQRSLIIVNSIELAIQAATQTKALFPHWSVEIEQGAKHNASGSADVYAFAPTSRSAPAKTQSCSPGHNKKHRCNISNAAQDRSDREVRCSCSESYHS